MARLRRRAAQSQLSDVVVMGPNLRIAPARLPDSLRVRLQRYAEAVDPERSEEIVSTVTLVYNGVLCSLLRGAPDDPPGLGRRVAAAALGWPE